MKLKLKESPREWQKFAAVICVLLSVLTYGGVRKGFLPHGALWVVGTVVGLILLSSWTFPRAYRGVYRTGMTVSFQVGQVMGQVLLTVLFLVMILPLGWMLRLLGKDLLGIRRLPPGASYWKTARDGREFDRMF